MASSALNRLRSTENLHGVWKAYWPHARRKTSCGVDGVTPRHFNDNLKTRLAHLSERLAAGYVHSPLRGIPIPKADGDKMRLICIPTVQDRVVQRALLQIIESKAARLGIINDVSFGFVKDSSSQKRGAIAARDAAARCRLGKPWAFKADITAFFDRIPRDQLVEDFEKRFRLRSLSPLIRGAVSCEVEKVDPFVRRVLKENNIRDGLGLRQGMPISPILSNFLLRNFDRAFARHGYDMVRYADDLVVFASSEGECRSIQDLAIKELEKLQLSLSEAKTMICPPEQPVDFLGMELSPKKDGSGYALRISDKKVARIKERFTIFHDLSYVLSRDMNVLEMFRYLEQMRDGYKVAYGAAENYFSFGVQLDKWVSNCAVSVYKAIFGSAAVSKLTTRHKTFLMMP